MLDKYIIPQTEYSKDPNLSRDDVLSLMNWIASQPHLPQATEFQAITFLHSSDYDLDDAKVTADRFFTLRTLHSYMFGPLEDAQLLRETLATVFIKILPDKTPEGDAILVCRLIDTRPSRFNMVNFQKVLDMIFMSHLYNSGTSNGLVQIFDMAGSGFGHMFKVGLKVAKHHVEYLQDGFPMRLKQIHFLNTSTITHAMLNIAKPFFNSEVTKMLFFHCGDNRTVYDYVPREILPREFCGTGHTISELQERQVEDLIGYLDLFRWLQKQQVDECKRNVGK